MQIFINQINQLRLCELYGAITELLDLDAQKVPDVTLIIHGVPVRAFTQVHDNGVYRVFVGTEDDAVIYVDEEDDFFTVIETWIEGARLEAIFLHDLVHVFIPYTTCLLLSVSIAYQLECVFLP